MQASNPVSWDQVSLFKLSSGCRLPPEHPSEMGTQSGQQTVAWQHSLGLRVNPGESTVAHTEPGQETEGSRVLDIAGAKRWNLSQGRESVDEATLPGDCLRRGMKMEREKKNHTHAHMHTQPSLTPGSLKLGSASQ